MVQDDLFFDAPTLMRESSSSVIQVIHPFRIIADQSAIALISSIGTNDDLARSLISSSLIPLGVACTFVKYVFICANYHDPVFMINDHFVLHIPGCSPCEVYA